MNPYKRAVGMVMTCEGENASVLIKESLEYADIVCDAGDMEMKAHAQRNFISGAWWFAQRVQELLPQADAPMALQQAVKEAIDAMGSVGQAIKLENQVRAMHQNTQQCAAPTTAVATETPKETKNDDNNTAH